MVAVKNMCPVETAKKIKIREMKVDDIRDVYQLGYELFHSFEFMTLYRTWDAHEVTVNFDQDPKLSLVVENTNGKIVGFALGKTYENGIGGWKYGHVLWMGVTRKYQKAGVGSQLYQKMERRMRQQGVRMSFVDMAESNSKARNFFERMGYGRPEAEVWMSKVIRRRRKDTETHLNSGLPRRRHRARRPPPAR
jgi:ribosomal protein S18 acetylase RimI-like enzyme